MVLPLLPPTLPIGIHGALANCQENQTKWSGGGGVGGGWPAMDEHPSPSRGGSNISSPFMLRKPWKAPTVQASELECRINLFLTLRSDQYLISPYNIPLESNIKVMRIKEMLTNLSSSWLLNKFSLPAPWGMYSEQYGEYGYCCQGVEGQRARCWLCPCLCWFLVPVESFTEQSLCLLMHTRCTNTRGGFCLQHSVWSNWLAVKSSSNILTSIL